MTAFIDEVKDRFRVEPICRVLTEHGVKIAPSTYCAAKTRPRSARAIRDERVFAEIERVWSDRTLGLYKTECVRPDEPFRSVEDLELATLSWVHWFNHDRLHSAIDYATPLERETEYYRHDNPQP